MGADYSIELISIETHAPQFIEHNKIFLGSVMQEMCLAENWDVQVCVHAA